MSKHPGGRSRPLTLESVGKIALVAALVAGGGDVLVRLLQVLVDGGRLDIVSLFTNQLVGAIGQAGLIGGVVAIIFGGTDLDFLLRVSAAVYAVQIAQTVIDELVGVVIDGSTFDVGGINLLIFPLYTVATFLGFVMAYRLYQRETILPGVDYRL